MKKGLEKGISCKITRIEIETGTGNDYEKLTEICEL